MNILLFVFLILFTHLKAQESEQMTVRLATEEHLMPIYLAKTKDSKSGFNQNYLDLLENVLEFDLNHNGRTFTTPQTAENERLVQKLLVEGTFYSKEWRPAIYSIVKLQVREDKKALLYLYSVNGDLSKNFEGASSLTGDLSKDRRHIHQLADALYKTLFDEEGIASTHILYSAKARGNINKWTADIWEADYDGCNARVVVKDGSYNISPSYVPPQPGCLSSNCCYISYKTAQPKIFLASLKDGVGRRLTYLSGNQLTPVISRQRDQVAFISDITGNPDLFLQDFSSDVGIKNKPRQLFAARKATQGSPCFSPDGKHLAFVSNKDGAPRIYVMEIPPPGTPLKAVRVNLITKHSRESTAPAWSPDGSKLAYCALINGVRQIWMYDFNSKEERQLTQGAGNKENPSWAPNSLCLIYNCSDTGACELFLLNVKQGHPTKISGNMGNGEKRYPSWEPR